MWKVSIKNFDIYFFYLDHHGVDDFFCRRLNLVKIYFRTPLPTIAENVIANIFQEWNKILPERLPNWQLPPNKLLKNLSLLFDKKR